jgi:hypothetical protein
MLTTTPNPIFDRRPEEAQAELRRRSAIRRTSTKRTLVSALQSKNAVKDIETLPALEETIHLIARGNFPLWSIVPAALTLAAPAMIEALSIATLGFSASNASDLLSQIDAGRIRYVSIVASVYFQRQNPAEYKIMAEGLAERGQRIVAIRSHAKVITLALSDGRRFAIESSANLRSCRNIEQISFTQSPALHAFHAGWINEVISSAEAADKKRGAK